MPKQVFPNNFQTKMGPGKVVIEITTAQGEFLAAYNLRHLSNMLINGERVDSSQKAAAGAAISHLLALQK